MKKFLWKMLGFAFLGVAYIGVVTPGIPWSTPCLIAAYCFAKGSEKWNNWIMNHRIFGPFIKDWNEKRIYPSKVKWIMFIGMDISLVTIWFTTYNLTLLISMALFFSLVMIWALRYPSTIEEYEKRKIIGKKIGWFK
jgi:uncharacterized protein